MPASPRDLPVWTFAAAYLRAGTPVAVLHSMDCSPDRQGFKMTVTADTMDYRQHRDGADLGTA